MNTPIAYAAAALLALSAAPAFAQTTRAPATPPGSEVNPPAASPPADTAKPAETAPSASPTPSTGAPSASASGANASVTTGMAVTDNTGLTIGQITEVKTDASGKKTATIKMGAETFALDTASLAVTGKSAQVNATQAEIMSMLAKK